MSKRVDRLISHIRSITENEISNSNTDIQDDEIIQYLNEAQNRIQARIVAQHPDIFVKEYIATAIADQEEYQLPDNIMLGNKLLSVEYSANISSSRPVWWRLKLGSPKYRESHISAIPVTYWRREQLANSSGSFLVSPPPNGVNGAFRINYVQKLDKLDIRRAVVSAVTLDTTALTITSLTFDVSGNPPIDIDAFADCDYFCIVDRYGNVKMRNIPFAIDGTQSIDTSSGVVTTDSSFVYTSGETIAVGDYVVGGQDTTTHSELSDDIERYLIQFAAYKIFKHDSNTDVSVQLNELQLLEKEIIESYQAVDEDSPDILVTDDWDTGGWGYR